MSYDLLWCIIHVAAVYLILKLPLKLMFERRTVNSDTSHSLRKYVLFMCGLTI